jgi:hypothetical protein
MGSYENAAQSFWHHIYTKDVFSDQKYATDYEDPPIEEEQGQRKVDQTVRELDEDWGIMLVLLFHEIKRNEIFNAGLEYLEMQGYTACESYCKKHNIAQVYTQTSVGSRARFFKYMPGSWLPVNKYPLGHWDAYHEFGDSEGEEYIVTQMARLYQARRNYKTDTVSYPLVFSSRANSLSESGNGMQIAVFCTTMSLPSSMSSKMVQRFRGGSFLAHVLYVEHFRDQLVSFQYQTLIQFSSGRVASVCCSCTTTPPSLLNHHTRQPFMAIVTHPG